MARLRIVLVEPREAGNVGAVARGMKNFGFTDLWIVGEHPTLEPVAGWWASGAEDLVRDSKRVATLAEALGDAHVTVATTSTRGRTEPVDFDPRSLGETFATLGDQTLALVFGREDRGLTSEEVAACQRTASIPTDPASPVMNLAQSVCVFSYELSRVAPRAAERELAPAALVERAHQRARSLLLDVGFLHETNADHIYDDVRRMIGRADLDAREVTMLLGMIRQIEWKLGRQD
jgi:tRNA/rRNA methyltransferase